MVTLMRTDMARAEKFISKERTPKPFSFGKAVTNGCDGFASKLLGWPEPLIRGGVERGADGNINHAESFQSVRRSTCRRGRR